MIIPIIMCFFAFFPHQVLYRFSKHLIMGNCENQYLYRNINYFKSLNGLRFFAAYLVLMHHSESIKSKNGFFSFNSFSLFTNGSVAVDFFFVLSGFLITYILLKEKQVTQNVNIRKFYLKRVIRIWPLYFLLTILGTIIIPFFINLLHIDYDMPYTFGQVWYYFLLFLPGLVTFHYGHHLLEPLWSIGVEEYFYLMWAPLFKVIKKHIFPALISIITIMIGLKLLTYLIVIPEIIKQIIFLFNFEGMAIGGLGAYFIFNLRRQVSTLFVYKKYVQIVIYSILIIFILFNSNISNPIWTFFFKTPIFSNILREFLFLYLIIGSSLITRNFINLDNKLLSNLGEISYGIYMFHVTIISIVIIVLKKFSGFLGPEIFNILFYTLVTIGTIGTAHISKKYFENYFLKFREKLNM